MALLPHGFISFLYLVICSSGLPLTCIQPLPFYKENITGYYEALISYNTEAAATYQPPTSNEEFSNGSTDPVDAFYGEYDFIIVGAGSAGSAVTAGLSERSDWKILLVEAGGDETDFSDIPFYYTYLANSSMNWGYFSTPQKKSCQSVQGSEGGRCTLPRGKVIGGTGTINGMLYVRGNKHDYDSFAEAGNPGWSYSDVLPEFIKQENSRVAGDLFYHGIGGPITVEYVHPPNPLLKNFIDANVALGRKIVDSNGREQLGVFHTQYFMNHGRRVSGGRAFIDKIKCRKNLQVLKHSLVTKVLIDDNNRVYGVEFIKNGEKFIASARKEVIVSGGALNSPQILLLSGIGPRDELESLGIEVKQDLPVGKNLQDQPYLILPFSTNFTIDGVPGEPTLIDQYLKGFGLYTSNSFEGQTFARFEDSTLAEGVPNIQIVFGGPTGNNESVTFDLLPFVLHEKSRGTITLTSSSPLDFPAIDFNFYDVEEDMYNMYQAVNAVFELINTEPFRRINATYQPYDFPECNALGYLTKEYWYCNFIQITSSGYHMTSTVKMGPKTDKEAVVDNRLKVYGIEGLRVADVSITPHGVSGNTNAPAFVIGGKAANIIKEDYS